MRIAYVMVILLFAPFASATESIDYFPWINTVFYAPDSGPDDFQNSRLFIATHYDTAIGNFENNLGAIRSRNLRVRLVPIARMNYILADYAQLLSDFQLDNGLLDYQVEKVFLHHKCNVKLSGQNPVPGCNLVNEEEMTCDPTNPPSECDRSDAEELQQSQAPPADSMLYTEGWRHRNYIGPIPHVFSLWYLERLLSETYSGANTPDGFFWEDNVYLPEDEYNGAVPYVEKTREYSDFINPQTHYADSYFSHYSSIAFNFRSSHPNLFFINDVTSMDTIDPEEYYGNEAIDELDHITPLSWVNPKNDGEMNTPSWIKDCFDLHETWDITTNRGHEMSVFSFNDVTSPGWDKTRAFSIAKYYLVQNPNLFYGYNERMGGDSAQAYQWNPMVEVNLGAPKINRGGVRDFQGNTGTNNFFDWLTSGAAPVCGGVVGQHAFIVMARNFDYGLVLARWKPLQCGDPTPECQSFSLEEEIFLNDQSKTYGEAFHIVNIDGTLSPEPVQSVMLATNEAVLLMNACREGIISENCACGGDIAEEGQYCCDDFVSVGPCSGVSPTPTPFPTCADQDGHICGQEETCPGDEWLNASDSGRCCADECEANASPTPPGNATFTPTPTLEPCSPEGALTTCVVNECDGLRSCINGYWRDCVKRDLCCHVICDDANDCTQDTCVEGMCYPISIPNCQSPTGKPNISNGSETNVSSPVLSPERLRELQKYIAQLGDSDEADELRRMMLIADELERKGRTDEARLLWQEVGSRLSNLLERQQETTRMYTFILAALAALALLAVMAFFAFRQRAPVPPSVKQLEREVSNRILGLEEQRVQLIKKFMKREIDYGQYAQLMAGIDKEIIEWQAKLDAKKR
ncbi:hypothetical protein KJ765_06650 [Candidatus Micrarchaeota archaeon]|nr:hypothetical protein [Candidatus Micrarchaeota archaeon]